ncbi:hypothetical protein CHU98_g8572 [Xylaria longipes]|nr:hypothetical protein CHU98_g8572 [Xylaria longipes]
MSLTAQVSSTLSTTLSQTPSTSNFSVPVASTSASSSNTSIIDTTVSTTSTISSSISSTYQSTSVSSPSASASSSGPSSNSTISSGSTTSSSSTTGSDSTTQLATGITSFTDLPPFTVPTVTLMAGPEETREAVKVAPFLWYLWQKKSSLQDQEHKQEYIDDVKKSRDDFASSISEVDLLTDTLKDIGDELDKQGDERTSSAQSSASSASSTSSSSSISSSCTTTITKTWESVVCTVTATPSANKKRQDQTCTTQVYSTVTGCSVIGSTTTSTTTITPGTTPIPQCSFESCGTGSTCPNKRRGLEKRLPRRVSQPEANAWAGPENYGGNNQDFMAGEVGLTYTNQDSVNQGVNLVEGTTSKIIPFFNPPGSLAVLGLYGCTSVIAVSKRGAWVSHMWEVPSFTSASGNPTPPTDLQQLDIFRQQVLMALHSGSGSDHILGLAQLSVPHKQNNILFN